MAPQSRMTRRTLLLAGTALSAAVLIPAQPLLSQPVELAVVDVKVVEKGYRASKLKDKTVVNEKGERIGKVDDIIIGKDGKIFAVLEVGGFLGVGDKLVAVPYESLNLEGKDGRVVLAGASREALKKLPVFKYVA